MEEGEISEQPPTGPIEEEVEIPYLASLAALIEKWRRQVRADGNEETIRNLKGGKVIKIPPKSELYPCLPHGLSQEMWEVLYQRYNASQLYAIKYIVEKFESHQDTRISLIQGNHQPH
jgi:hypothetical protein